MVLRVRVLFLTALVSFIAADGAATGMEGDLRIDVLELCPPQLGRCVSPDDPCAWLAEPGRYMGVTFRVTESGEPLPFASFTARGHEVQKEGLTGQNGQVRLALEPSHNITISVEHAGRNVEVPLPIIWSGVHVERVSEAVHLATIGEAKNLTINYRLTVQDVDLTQSLEQRPVLFSDAHGNVFGSNPQPDGLALWLFGEAGGWVQYRPVDVDACSLPVAAANPFWVYWSSPNPSSAGDSGSEPSGPPTSPTAQEGDTADSVQESSSASSNGSSGETVRSHNETESSVLTLDIPRVEGWSTESPFEVPYRVQGGEIRWRLQGEAQWRPPPLKLIDGEHHVEVRVIAHDGRTSPIVERFYKVDATAPLARLEGGGKNWSDCSDTAWIVDDLSGIANQEIRIGGQTVPSNTSEDRINFAPPQGDNYITVLVRDVAGNLATENRRLRCDATPPTVAAKLLGDRFDGFFVSSVALQAIAEDEASGVREVRARVDDGPWVDPASLRVEGEGAFAVTVEAVDYAGNQVTHEIKDAVDTIPPSVNAPDSIEPGARRVIIRASDDGSGLKSVQILLPSGNLLAGKPLENDTYRFQIPSNMEPTDKLVIRAIDEAGHETQEVVRVVDRQLEEGSFRVQSLVVTPQEGRATEEIRVSALVEGVRRAKVILVDEGGDQKLLGTVTVREGRLEAYGHAPAPGQYDLILELETEDGETVTHFAGTITVEPADPFPIPGHRFVIGLVFVVLLAVFWRKAETR